MVNIYLFIMRGQIRKKIIIMYENMLMFNSNYHIMHVIEDRIF